MVNLSTKSFPGAQFWLARERLGLMPRKRVADRFWVVPEHTFMFENLSPLTSQVSLIINYLEASCAVPYRNIVKAADVNSLL